MFKKLISIIITVAILHGLSGCASMADATSKMAGLGVVSEKKSTFDEATIVEVSPNWLYDPNGSWGNSVKLGARWSSSSPEYVALVLSYGSTATSAAATYVNLTGIDVNVDGEKKFFSPGKPTNFDDSGYNTISKTIYTESTNSVLIPYSMLEKMVNAKDCRLRIHTGQGYEDAQFSIERMPGGQGTAILSLREFIKKINS